MYNGTDKEKQAVLKYNKEKIDQFSLRVPKGKLADVREKFIVLQNLYPNNPRFKSLNTFIISLLEENLEIEITGVYKEAQFHLVESEAKKEWIDEELFCLSATDREIIKLRPEYKDYILSKLEDKWPEVKEEVITKYLAKKEN